MEEAPNYVSKEQLDELGIQVLSDEKDIWNSRNWFDKSLRYRR
jgi:hypothetical protein